MSDAEMWKAYEQWNATAPKVQAARSIWQAAYRAAQEDCARICEERADWYWQRDGMRDRHADGTDYAAAIRERIGK